MCVWAGACVQRCACRVYVQRWVCTATQASHMGSSSKDAPVRQTAPSAPSGSLGPWGLLLPSPKQLHQQHGQQLPRGGPPVYHLRGPHPARLLQAATTSALQAPSPFPPPPASSSASFGAAAPEKSFPFLCCQEPPDKGALSSLLPLGSLGDRAGGLCGTEGRQRKSEAHRDGSRLLPATAPSSLSKRIFQVILKDRGPLGPQTGTPEVARSWQTRWGALLLSPYAEGCLPRPSCSLSSLPLPHCWWKEIRAALPSGAQGSPTPRPSSS